MNFVPLDNRVVCRYFPLQFHIVQSLNSIELYYSEKGHYITLL